MQGYEFTNLMIFTIINNWTARLFCQNDSESK